MLLQIVFLFTAIVSVLDVQNNMRPPSPQPSPQGRGGLSTPLLLAGESQGEKQPQLSAKSAFLIDLGSEIILLQKNADAARPIASITKLMTALVVFDALTPTLSQGERGMEWTDYITFEAQDRRNGGIPYLIPGEQLSIKDAWNLMLVGSSNDAAALLARVFYDSEDKFVAAMNVKAGELGLQYTSFTDPTGLQAGNISTARETAAVARLALGFEAIRNAVRLRQVNIYPKGKPPRLVYSTNWLLSSSGSREEIFGGKTGHIEESGYNLVLTSGREGHELVGVILGAESNEARFEEMRALLNWGFTISKIKNQK